MEHEFYIFEKKDSGNRYSRSTEWSVLLHYSPWWGFFGKPSASNANPPPLFGLAFRKIFKIDSKAIHDSKSETKLQSILKSKFKKQKGKAHEKKKCCKSDHSTKPHLALLFTLVIGTADPGAGEPLVFSLPLSSSPFTGANADTTGRRSWMNDDDENGALLNTYKY